MSVKHQLPQLLEVSNPDLFLKNAFRVTWLPTTASNREISRHADRLKMQAELGTGVVSVSSIFALDPPPSVDQVREAMNKLKDPKLRLIDEFFWYWPEDLEDPNSDPALAAVGRGDDETARTLWEKWESDPSRRMVASHNLAVMYHMLAIDWTLLDLNSPFDSGQTEKLKMCWERAFDRWETLATDDEMWDRLKDRIREINDPALPSGTARRLRDTLPESVDRVNAEFAVRYATARRFDMARWHVNFMKETHQGLDDTTKTSTEVLAPTKRRIEALTADFEKAIRNNVAGSLYAVKTLLDESSPYLQLFDLFHGEDSHERNEMFDQVASLCRSGLVPYYNETQDATGVVAMLTTTLAYASSISLREEIQESISTIQGNQDFAKVKEFFDLLKKIGDLNTTPAQRLARFKTSFQQEWDNFLMSTSLPSETLSQVSDSIAIFLRGLAIEANNEHNDTRTGLQGIQLASKYARSAEIRQRVAADLKALELNSAVQSINAKQSGNGCLFALFLPLSVVGVVFLRKILS
jgi:hypothetical protein